MTLEGEIIEFLVRHRGQVFCDSCLQRELQISPRAGIASATAAIGVAIGFRQVTTECAGCGKVRDGIGTS